MPNETLTFPKDCLWKETKESTRGDVLKEEGIQEYEMTP